MLPLSLLKTAQNHPMLVELKNGETYNGHLVSCDNWMNINLREVICTSRVCLGVVVAACQEWAEASSSRRRSQVVPNLRESRISTEEIEAGYQREVYSRFHSMSTLLVRGHSGWCNSRPGSLC
uniref:U6 snRNA-associated Sm-like protein LSm4 n=1 Tax=Esox lucius TaxID=8010 RepID=A0A3P9A0G7_ESOLU